MDESQTPCTPRHVLRIFADVKLSCNLRVLGSQLGLDPAHLDEIQDLPRGERMMKILETSNDRVQGLSWSLLMSVLRKPALKEYSAAFSIECYTSRSMSETSNSSVYTEGLLRSVSTSTCSPESSLTSNMDAGKIVTLSVQLHVNWTFPQLLVRL